MIIEVIIFDPYFYPSFYSTILIPPPYFDSKVSKSLKRSLKTMSTDTFAKLIGSVKYDTARVKLNIKVEFLKVKDPDARKKSEQHYLCYVNK